MEKIRQNPERFNTQPNDKKGCHRVALEGEVIRAGKEVAALVSEEIARILESRACTTVSSKLTTLSK